MSEKNIENILERIAISLERIADCLDENKKMKKNFPLNKEKILNDMDLIENIASISYLPEKEEEEPSNFECIENFLSSRGIKIKTIPEEDPADDIINSLSEFLGNNYDSLKELLSKIKRTMQTGSYITLSLKNYEQKACSDVCQFCHRLYAIAFLEQYKYFKSPQYLIKAKTTTLPVAQNFFSGKWLERYVLLSVEAALKLIECQFSVKLNFSHLINPQVILPNGNDFELDLLFCINDIFFWIEAKSGDYQQHISKYSKISKLLKLDEKHSIMVLADIPSAGTEALTSLFSMNVVSLTELRNKIIGIIENDIESGILNLDKKIEDKEEIELESINSNNEE